MRLKSRDIIWAELCLLSFLVVFAALRFYERTSSRKVTAQTTEQKAFIQWVDFDVSCGALKDAYNYDISTYEEDIHLDWIELLACLAVQYGGDFSKYLPEDMEETAGKIRAEGIEKVTADWKYYDYYREAYGAVLGGLVGSYEIEAEAEGGGGEKVWKQVYGLKGFSPIAKGFYYSHYDDFGASRSYGYQRNHLGHDLMGQVGTPVIAIESGRVTALGWNQYGGWRIGIDSMDGKRYYYYAHLRQNRPYAEGLSEGDIVRAGDVIGYMGRTGYSAEENVNNIDTYHLHLGMQLIFDESQREGTNEIWIDLYPLVQFLSGHTSEAVRDEGTKEWRRLYQIKDPAVDGVPDV